MQASLIMQTFIRFQYKTCYFSLSHVNKIFQNDAGKFNFFVTALKIESTFLRTFAAKAVKGSLLGLEPGEYFAIIKLKIFNKR